jgi:hypothetical protein
LLKYRGRIVHANTLRYLIHVVDSMKPRRRPIILGLLLNPLCPGGHSDKAVAFLVDYFVLILVAYQRDLAHP